MMRILADIPTPFTRGIEFSAMKDLARRAEELMRDAAASSPLAKVSLDDVSPAGVLPSPAREKLRLLLKGEAVSVTTGQQPALLGGPALVLFKAATAVETARRLELKGIPACPVFWNAADDTDYGEAGRGWWVTDRFVRESVELPAGFRLTHRMVGSIPAAEVIRPVRELISGSGMDGFSPDARRWVRELWEDSATDAQDLGEVFSRLLARVFAEQGLVVIDARAAGLMRCTRPLLAAYLANRGEMEEELAARARELGSGEEGPVLDPSTISWCLFRRAGDMRIPLSEESREAEAQALLGDDPPALSCNVVLRPLLEDYLFPHVARVAGPTEIRYHDEIAPAYRVLDVHRPTVIARLGATLIPPELVRLGHDLGKGIEGLWEDFDGWMASVADELGPGRARDSLLALEESWRVGVDNLREALGDEGDLLKPQLDRADRKVDFELRRVADGLSRLGRRALKKRYPRQGNLKEFVFPRGRAQERTISATSFLLLWGRDSGAKLCRLAAHHLDRWEAGEWSHLAVPIEFQEEERGAPR